MEHLKFSEILQQNKLLSNTIQGTPYNITILSNVTVNSFKDILEYHLRTHEINPKITIGNFDNIVQDSANCKNENLVIVLYDILNIIDNISSFFEDINDELYINIQQKFFSEIDIIFNNLKYTPSVTFNTFSSAYIASGFTNTSKIEALVSSLNSYIEQKKSDNISILNIDKIITQIGLKQSIDRRFYHSSKAPYTLAFFKEYAIAIEPIIFKNTGKLKKAIIFDCDNTLWKGIIGEDGIDKIDMSPTSAYGKIFNQIQQIAVYLSKRGVIVGICSKNNQQDVDEVLTKHQNMFLKKEYIVIEKVNWKDKATNLREIANELNIGIDSLVFVDDSSFEINLIKEQLPEVVALQVPTAIYEYPNFLLKKIYRYFNLTANKDDAQKTQIYKQQFERENEKADFKSIDEYLASLQIELTIVKNDLSSIPRIAQLTQKTNQFNLTTIRYTETQIQQFMENGKDAVFSVNVKDKFGDNGLTAICIIKQDAQNHQIAYIDTFLMSCRVIGRNIETAFLSHIFKWLKDKNYTSVVAQFIATAKNTQVQDFYANFGGKITNNSGELKEYVFDLNTHRVKSIEYIHIETKK